MFKKIFITGVDGFVGIYMARYFLEKGCQVAGTSWSFDDSKTIQEIKKDASVEKINILDSDSLVRFIKKQNPEAVVHLAAQAAIPPSWKDPAGTLRINNEGTYNLFFGIQALNRDIPILVIGAAAEYGHVKCDGSLISEEDRFSPDNPYAVSKIAEEMIAYQYYLSHGLHTVRARPFTHVGPGQDSRFVCSEFSRAIAQMERGLIPCEMRVGNLEIRRDFLDVRDVITAYDLILEKGKKGEVYNVCSSKGTSIGEILQLLQSNSEKKIKVIIDENKVRKNEALAIVGDNSKIKRELGWTPKYDLEKTILDMLDYWRERV
jgi:GDP-4-dehydro-6-deoxy-D-mannose reductase